MREKLTALIQEAVRGCSKYWASVIADHLIDHGVTINDGEIDFDYGAEV